MNHDTLNRGAPVFQPRGEVHPRGTWAGMMAGIIVLCLIGCERAPDPPAPAGHGTRRLTRAVREADPPPEPAQSAAAPAPNRALQLPVYDLLMDLPELERLEHHPSSNERVSASLVAEGITYQGVEVRLRGAWSRGWPKKSLKLFFSDGQPLGDAHTINLNSGWRDPAFIREPLAYHVYGACGALTLKSRMVRLHLQGQFRGLYVEVEQPEKAFLRRMRMKGASVYKAISPSNQADERDHGGEMAYAPHYSQETRKQKGGYDELRQFCHDLAQAPRTGQFFEQYVDLEKYINYLAATVLTQNWDSFNKNHFLIFDGQGTRKWYVLPWDLDRTFGDLWNWTFHETKLPIVLGTRRAPGITGWNRLEDRFFSDPDLLARFLDRLNQLLEEEFTAEKLFPMIDRLQSEIAAEAVLDRRRWPSQTGSFPQGITQVKQYVQQRRAYLLEEIPKLRRLGTSYLSEARPTMQR